MFRVFFIGIIGVCLLGCSDKEWEQADTADVPAGESGKTLLTISLSLPKTADSRSQTNQQGGTGSTEEGLDQECRVENAWVILGELADGQQAPIKISQTYFIDRFQYAGNPAQWSATIPCKPGNYRIAIVINPGSLITWQQLPPTSWDALSRYVIRCQTYQELQQIWRENRFLMSNAYRGRPDDNDVVLTAGQHTYKDIHVQRICARFDYQVAEADNRYRVPCSIDGTPSQIPVQLSQVAFMNVSNNFNLFKMVVPDNQSGRVPDFYQYETNENYVYDSDWTEKRIFHTTPIFQDERLKEFFFFPSERNAQDPTPPAPLEYIPLPKALNLKDSILAYASENTLPGILAQINKLSTGVVFKGSFQLPGIPPVQEVYYRSLRNGNELYTSVERLKQVLHQEGYILPLEPTDADWAKLEVVKFCRQPDGSYPVWYTYWNRHNDNHDPQQMGIMEFAVVRNNIYKLKVHKITSLGLPLAPDDPTNPWKPAGNTPDERLPQIDVSVEVCDWVERELIHEI